ncbi:hypothetical protein MM239_14735 [Belliella sp. DSM 111904]|uniref:Uncharacterized protein n=1 Tax=Belliella filtrata TaxID=2923435 RepID=A0ABS9V2Q4_9BACT|nr:hypothetical protein [Belliella filtrata]MCH7410661.1 hypothetical protein [Belliella filtrata]
MPLTTEQQQNFEAFAARLGFQSGEHTSTLPMTGFKNEASSKKRVFSKDPSLATTPHKLVSIGNIDALKAAIGASNHENDEHITYPDPLNIEPNVKKRDLSMNQVQHLKRIAHAYIHGNSKKISESDKTLINNTLFPTTLAAYSEPDYTVKSGEILELHEGTVANYGVLTVEPGGEIRVLGDASMNCQVFIQQS